MSFYKVPHSHEVLWSGNYTGKNISLVGSFLRDLNGTLLHAAGNYRRGQCPGRPVAWLFLGAFQRLSSFCWPKAWNPGRARQSPFLPHTGGGWSGHFSLKLASLHRLFLGMAEHSWHVKNIRKVVKLSECPTQRVQPPIYIVVLRLILMNKEIWVQ